LYAAVQALDQGMVVASPVFMEALLEQADLAEASIVQAGETMSGLREPLVEPLTERETQVLQYVALGLANKQIAVQLGISEHTVKFHISSIYAKLGATSRTEAVRLGVQKGLILL
jgi:NarL family two-component system response regulator YdfI